MEYISERSQREEIRTSDACQAENTDGGAEARFHYETVLNFLVVTDRFENYMGMMDFRHKNTPTHLQSKFYTQF